MNIQFCLPIQNSSMQEIERIIDVEKKRDEYAYFEIWLDLIENLDELFFHRLVNAIDSRLIIHFRRPNLEPIHTPIEKRKYFITELYRSGKKALLDVDISQKEELHFTKEKQYNVPLILSYHNYSETPEDKKLQEIIDTMKPYNPFMYKIATYCQNPEDAVTLMRLLVQLKKQNKKSIVSGMGQYGMITRIFGALYGNEITFTPKTKETQSALGQLTIAEMKKICKAFRV